MWGSLGTKEFSTRPELIECKTFMHLIEKKLQRKRKHQSKVFDELKEIVTSRLIANPSVTSWTDDNENLQRQDYFKENNRYITAAFIVAYDNNTKEKISDALEFTSGPSDAYHIIVERFADGKLRYDLDP